MNAAMVLNAKRFTTGERKAFVLALTMAYDLTEEGHSMSCACKTLTHQGLGIDDAEARRLAFEAIDEFFDAKIITLGGDNN